MPISSGRSNKHTCTIAVLTELVCGEYWWELTKATAQTTKAFLSIAHENSAKPLVHTTYTNTGTQPRMQIALQPWNKVLVTDTMYQATIENSYYLSPDYDRNQLPYITKIPLKMATTHHITRQPQKPATCTIHQKATTENSYKIASSYHRKRLLLK